jgi:UDPglucose 6-dehydrogenase
LEKLPNYNIKAYDPIVDARIAGKRVSGSSSALETVKGADAVAIMTPWPEFREIKVDNLVQHMTGRVVNDPYRILDDKALGAQGFT